MKTVFNHAQLAHVWAAQSQPTGRGSRMHFNGTTIYSHGTHFPIACFVKPGVVLFNDDSYSNSTAKHKGHVWSALYGLPVRMFKVPTRFVTGHDAAGALETFHNRRDAALTSAAKARTHTAMHLEYAERLETDARDFAQAFDLPAPTFPEYDRAAILQRIRKQAADSKAERAAAEAKRAAEIAAREAQYPAVLAAWRRHDPTPPDCFSIGHYQSKPTALRLSLDGKQIETSRGAEVPLNAGVKVWGLITYCRVHKALWGGAEDVGLFSLRSIDEYGNAVIGCHTLEYQETERFASAQGWKI